LITVFEKPPWCLTLEHSQKFIDEKDTPLFVSENGKWDTSQCNYIYGQNHIRYGMPGKYTGSHLPKLGKDVTMPIEIICVLIFIFSGYTRSRYKA
jgi:hypothetical protein